MNVHIVVVDNGDTTPELWAFASEAKAEEFSIARGGFDVDVQTVAIQSDEQADELIANERAQP